MPILSAENSFRRGLTALADGDPESASSHFQAAIVTELQHGVRRPQMRYLSYYGLSRAKVRGANTQAIQACETAARRDFFNPDLHLNLGRVYLLAGKTSKALAAFQRGLEVAPTHKALLAEHSKIDRRESPPLSFISRSHPLNRTLGKLRAAAKTRSPRLLGAPRTTDNS